MHLCIFFFNDTATTEIYTLSLHDALPILVDSSPVGQVSCPTVIATQADGVLLTVDAQNTRKGSVQRAMRSLTAVGARSEEHTSELQSRQYLVCRLLLEKKKNINNNTYSIK